jgi:hypothetical protein
VTLETTRIIVEDFFFGATTGGFVLGTSSFRFAYLDMGSSLLLTSDVTAWLSLADSSLIKGERLF